MKIVKITEHSSDFRVWFDNPKSVWAVFPSKILKMCIEGGDLVVYDHKERNVWKGASGTNIERYLRE